MSSNKINGHWDFTQTQVDESGNKIETKFSLRLDPSGGITTLNPKPDVMDYGTYIQEGGNFSIGLFNDVDETTISYLGTQDTPTSISGTGQVTTYYTEPAEVTFSATKTE